MQFKAADANAVPLAVILGDDELAAGQVRVKQLGLPDGHPDKDGVLVPLVSVAEEVKAALGRLHGGKQGVDVDEAVAESVQKLGVE